MSEERCELVEGEIIMVNGAGLRRDRVVTNLIGLSIIFSSSFNKALGSLERCLS